VELTSLQSGGRLVRLSEELQNADIGKFKEELKRVLSPKKPLKIVNPK